MTGSIAAYKAVELASKLTQAGALVDVLLTPGAEKFVTPLTFQSVTGQESLYGCGSVGRRGARAACWLGTGRRPAGNRAGTANTIAKLAHGMADNLVTITALAARCPVLIAPAMDVGMYEHTATQENIKILAERGVVFRRYRKRDAWLPGWWDGALRGAA